MPWSVELAVKRPTRSYVEWVKAGRPAKRLSPYGQKHQVPLEELSGLRKYSLVEPQFHNDELLGADRHLRYLGVLDLDFAAADKEALGLRLRELKTIEAVRRAMPMFDALCADVQRLLTRLGDRPMLCFFSGCRGFRVLFWEPSLLTVASNRGGYTASALSRVLEVVGEDMRDCIDASAFDYRHGVKHDLSAHPNTGLWAVRWPCEVLASETEDTELSRRIVAFWCELGRRVQALDNVDALPCLLEPPPPAKRQKKARASAAVAAAEELAYLELLWRQQQRPGLSKSGDDAQAEPPATVIENVRATLSDSDEGRQFFNRARARLRLTSQELGWRGFVVYARDTYVVQGRVPRQLEVKRLGDLTLANKTDVEACVLRQLEREEAATGVAEGAQRHPSVLAAHRRHVEATSHEESSAIAAAGQSLEAALAHFPPCMAAILARLRERGELKDEARLQLFAFTRTLGIAQHELEAYIVRFTATQQAADELANRIAYSYQKGYKAWSCTRMCESARAAAPGVVQGCAAPSIEECAGGAVGGGDSPWSAVKFYARSSKGTDE